jgi:hypothetical protein
LNDDSFGSRLFLRDKNNGERAALPARDPEYFFVSVFVFVPSNLVNQKKGSVFAKNGLFPFCPFLVSTCPQGARPPQEATITMPRSARGRSASLVYGWRTLSSSPGIWTTRINGKTSRPLRPIMFFCGRACLFVRIVESKRQKPL